MIVHHVKIRDETSGQSSGREHKKIYVGCAESDIQYRDMLVYGRHRWELYSKPMIDFITIDRKGVEFVHHKPIVDTAIQKADGVMMIVSARTSNDPLALWEIGCSLFNSIPIVGIDVRQKSGAAGIIPAGLEGKMAKFGWEWFAAFFNAL